MLDCSLPQTQPGHLPLRENSGSSESSQPEPEPPRDTAAHVQRRPPELDSQRPTHSPSSQLPVGVAFLRLASSRSPLDCLSPLVSLLFSLLTTLRHLPPFNDLFIGSSFLASIPLHPRCHLLCTVILKKES